MSADRDLEGDDPIGSGERFEEAEDEAARRVSFERAAAAGPDELAGVVEENLRGLADMFEDRVTRTLKDFGTELVEAVRPTNAQRSQFVSGAIFGAIVFAGGVLLGRRK